MNINEEIESILQESYKKIKILLENKKEIVTIIAEKLFEEKILLKKDLEKIIEDYEKKQTKK